MTAILAGCRIVSPRLRSGRTLTSNRNKDFNRNRAPRRTPHNRLATDRLTSPSVRAAMIVGALRLGRIVRATDFRTEVRDRIARSKSAMRVIATIDIRRDGRPRDFRPYRDPQPPRDAGADAAAPPGLPSFITQPETQQRGADYGGPVARDVGVPDPDRDAGGCSVRVRIAVGGKCFSSPGPTSAAAVALRIWRSDLGRRRAAGRRSGNRRRHACQGIAAARTNTRL